MIIKLAQSAGKTILDAIGQTTDGLPSSVTTNTSPITIAINLIDILLGLVGLVFVALVIYAGFKWMTSRGNPDTIAESKKTIINGVVGVAITLLAFSIANFVVYVLVLTPSPSKNVDIFCQDIRRACCSPYGILKEQCVYPGTADCKAYTQEYCTSLFGPTGEQCKVYGTILTPNTGLCQTCRGEGCSDAQCLTVCATPSGGPGSAGFPCQLPSDCQSGVCDAGFCTGEQI